MHGANIMGQDKLTLNTVPPAGSCEASRLEIPLEISPFCCRASCLLVSMSCSVAARFLGRLPVLPTASRGLCRAKQ